MENKELLKKELVLLLTLGCSALKGTPYLKVFNDKLGITKEQFKYLKSLSIYQLQERYCIFDNLDKLKKGEET